jgi:Cof subfamily protein (haloacid dehalogenase superfamily)
MNVKLVITDLDNTLLRRDKTVSDRTVQAFRRLRELGIRTSFATARPKRAVFQYLDILEKIEFDAMVIHNGADIYCGGTLAANYGISPETAGELAREFTRMGLRVGVELDDRNYSNYDAGAEWEGMQYVLTDFNSLPDKPADKIIIHKPSKADIKQVQSIIPENLYIEMNEGILGLIMSREATKLRAMRFLSEKYGVAPSEIAAFGDDLNDIEMLRESGFGVAVSNALDEVKAVANHICGDCDDCGVAQWLERRVIAEI